MTNTNWLKLIEGDDPEWFADEVFGALFEVRPGEVTARSFHQHCQVVARSAWKISGYPLGSGKTTQWSDDTWKSWLKARALELNLYFVAHPSDHPMIVTAILHIGFLSLEETEEHLERLRNPAEANLAAASVARSKIGKTNITITPVDGMAARVTGIKKGGEE